MKHLYLLLIVAISLGPLHAKNATRRDSLLNLAKSTKVLQVKANAYRNLADLYFEKPEEQAFLKLTYRTATLAGDQTMVLSTLQDISHSFIKTEQFDSAKYYMKLIEKEAGTKNAELYLSYLRMKMFDTMIRKGKAEAEAAMKEELDIFKNADQKSIFIQIEQAYITGSSLLEYNKYKESIPYLDTAYKLSSSLPEEKAYKYITMIQWVYGSVFKYVGEREKNLTFIKEVLKHYQDYYQKYYAPKRPFYPIHLYYLQCYASIIMYIDILPKEKTNYYIQQIKELIPNMTEPIDKYNCYLALKNYSLFNHDYKGALASNDTLIKYVKIIAPTILPGLLQTQSATYEMMHDYKNSLAYHKLYAETKDSLNSKQAQEQLNRLQVQYEVDKLTYEKTRLENKNKQMLLIALGITLLLTFAGCAYLYFNLKRERLMKKKLRELNEKANESEKLKTAFLNSMCHEIRTPLNAIVGFSGIIVDESIDCESKNEFYGEITRNTNLLTSLIDHLLVVANLDSSEEMLPCESTDIKVICYQEIEKAHREGKETISYHLETSEEELFANSNHRYLALVIENLLNNANKFTSEGSITLKASMEEVGKILQISVTDTGCGIPVEKREVVFERFTKLDSFTQGNGLGLYLCQLIIKRLSGEIYIDSNYTNGSRFVIKLPV